MFPKWFPRKVNSVATSKGTKVTTVAKGAKGSTKGTRVTKDTRVTKGAKVAKGAKTEKYVYFFGNGKADGDRTMKDTLGGKGAGLAEMTNAGLPVPPGFTISTDACNLYYELGQKLTPAIEHEILENRRKLETAAGATLGSADNPLLVSVRS